MAAAKSVLIDEEYRDLVEKLRAAADDVPPEVICSEKRTV